MLAQERQDRITQLVEEHGSVSGSALVEELGASPATIRRDIETLARAGRVIKVHGGATAVHNVVYETSDRAMDEKYPLYIDEKDAIATYAATEVFKFVMGEYNFDEDWDNFIGQIEDMGLQDCIDIYQGAYDRYVEAYGV